MSKKYLKNLITFSLIVSFVVPLPYFSFVETVSAQVSGGYNTQAGALSSGGFGGSGGISSYLQNLGPALKQLPLCKKKISGKTATLFSHAKSLVDPKQATSNLNLSSITDEVATDKILVYDSSSNEKLDAQGAKLDSIQKGVSSIDENDTCLKSIGRMVIKSLLQKITVSTANWIRTGVRGDGGPAFVQDPKTFFSDIARNEILQFGAEINNPELFPFGQAFLQNVAGSYNRKFQDNARYSLNELIQSTTPEYSAVSFSTDFSKGGWDAWTALTAVPANNPLGFQLMASNELAVRLEGTYKSPANEIRDAITQANGFLGDNRCADPEGLTLEQHNAALEAGNQEIESFDFAEDGVTIIGTNYTGQIDGICKRWEYVTPGKVISEAATKLVNYTDNNLLKAEDLNDAVAAITDALLARFSSDLMTRGLAGFSDQGSDGNLILDQNNLTGNYIPSQTELDFAASQLGSNWLQENPDFNIRTDITQALIDEQRTYITKLEEQNTKLQELIKSVRQLDYCIPGPNPNWQGQSSIDELYESVKYEAPGSGLKDVLASITGSFDPTGIFSGVQTAVLKLEKEKNVKRQIAHYLTNLLDVHIYGSWSANVDGLGFPQAPATPNPDQFEQDQILNETGIKNMLANTFETYRQVIQKTYFAGANSLAVQDGAMPLVTPEARNEFNRISAYEQIIEDNYEKLTTMKSVVIRLTQVKQEIADLGPNPDIEALKPWIAYFSRLSNEMVTGNDIADVDNVLKEINSKRDYVWNDLLKGEGGCEKSLENLHVTDPNTYSKYVRRQPYPYPVYYLYGTVDTGDSYEWNAQVPWNKFLLKDWNGNEGFLYGSVYWNFWTRPYERSNPNETGEGYETLAYLGAEGLAKGIQRPPQLNSISSACPNEFIDIVEISLPGPEFNTLGFIKDKGLTKDILGLEPAGKNGVNQNTCGIITRKFEKIFGIY
jgi:hypothetical protein